MVIVTDMVLNDDEKESCYQEKYLGENTNKLNEICQAQLGQGPKKFFSWIFDRKEDRVF